MSTGEGRHTGVLSVSLSGMALIHRVADSCLTITTGAGTTLIDPGFYPFDSNEIDLGTIGEVQRILITHEHFDHVKPEFVRWLIDRGTDVAVYANQAVADLLAYHNVAVDTSDPPGVTSEDVTHGITPLGAAPPNRAYTVEDLLTHPGDSQEPSTTAPVLALPMIAPWTSTTEAVAFARRLRPRQVIPVHDFYLSRSGRERIAAMVKAALADDGIEVVPLDWGESYTV